jgi:hypothetical protein
MPLRITTSDTVCLCYAECRCTECRYAECRTECCYAECRCTECRYADCRHGHLSTLFEQLFCILRTWRLTMYHLRLLPVSYRYRYSNTFVKLLGIIIEAKCSVV